MIINDAHNSIIISTVYSVPWRTTRRKPGDSSSLGVDIIWFARLSTSLSPPCRTTDVPPSPKKKPPLAPSWEPHISRLLREETEETRHTLPYPYYIYPNCAPRALRVASCRAHLQGLSVLRKYLLCGGEPPIPLSEEMARGSITNTRKVIINNDNIIIITIMPAIIGREGASVKAAG